MDFCVDCKHHIGPKGPAKADEHKCNKFHEECRVVRMEHQPEIFYCDGFEKMIVAG